MGLLHVIDRTGDTKIIWDKNNADEVDQARRTFEELRKKGYYAYSVKTDGEKGQLLTEFNPHEEKTILAPRMVGG